MPTLPGCCNPVQTVFGEIAILTEHVIVLVVQPKSLSVNGWDCPSLLYASLAARQLLWRCRRADEYLAQGYPANRVARYTVFAAHKQRESQTQQFGWQGVSHAGVTSSAM